MTLFDRVFGGSDYNYERTVAAIDKAISDFESGKGKGIPDNFVNLNKTYQLLLKIVLYRLKKSCEASSFSKSLKDKYLLNCL